MILIDYNIKNNIIILLYIDILYYISYWKKGYKAF